MIIDFHAHFFPEKLFLAIWDWFEKYGWHVDHQIHAEEVAQKLKEAGVDRYVILNYAHKPEMSASLNKWTYEFSKTHPEAIPFGTVHPDDIGLNKILETCFLDYHFKGLKFHTHVAAIRPDDERMFPIYEKLIEHDRILMLHAGTGPSLHGYHEHTADVSGAKFVRAVLKKYPKLKLIVPHLGAEEFGPFFDLMAEFPNLWMDTTMAVSGYFPFTIPWDSIEKFSERIVYGSDFPNLPYPLDTEIRAIQKSPLTKETQQRIFYKNAQRLLKC